MHRSFLATLSLFLFGCGIFLGTNNSTNKLVFPWVFWVWLLTLGTSIFLPIPISKLILLLSLFLGFWSGWCHIHQYTSKISDSFDENQTLNEEVIITDAPDIRPDKTYLTVKLVHSESIHNRILLTTDSYPKYHFGDHLHISGHLQHPLEIEGFNYPLYLQKSGITATIRLPTISYVSQTNSIQRGLFWLREQIERHVNDALIEPESSFLNGILLGSKRAIPSDIQNELKLTGTTHIIAISGANITILLSLLLQVLPLYRPRSKLIAIIIIAVFISLLTGASASVLRGAAVAILGSWLRWQERLPRAFAMTVIPAAVMLIFNPLLLVADPGFQLSFAAYAGLLFLGNYAIRLANIVPIIRKLPEVVRASFAETLAASIGTAPISFLLFGYASAIGLLVNPAILWLLPAITLLGLLLISIGWWHPIGFLITLPLWFMLHVVLRTIHYFSKLAS